VSEQNTNIPFKKENKRMALQKPKDDGMDLGFKVPAAGEYLWQITDGVKVYFKDGPGRSIQIPMQIIEAIRGDEEALLGKGTLFMTVITKEGVKANGIDDRLAKLLNLTGLFDEAITTFGPAFGDDEKDWVADNFIAWLNIKMAGKVIYGKHDIKIQSGKEQINFTHLDKSTYRSDGKGVTGGASGGATGQSFD
jgi:hypothetical protein